MENGFNEYKTVTVPRFDSLEDEDLASTAWHDSRQFLLTQIREILNQGGIAPGNYTEMRLKNIQDITDSELPEIIFPKKNE